jgi:hypothetical protein
VVGLIRAILAALELWFSIIAIVVGAGMLYVVWSLITS